jgi:hypothetical protein
MPFWNNKHWLQLQKKHQESEYRCFEGKIGGVKVESGTMAGRMGMTLTKGHCTFSFLGSDTPGDKYFTCSSYEGTAKDLLTMLNMVHDKFDLSKLKAHV